MCPEREAEGGIVVHHLPPGGRRLEPHERLRHLGLDPTLAGVGGLEQRQGRVVQGLDGPRRPTAGQREGAVGVRLGQARQRPNPEPGAALEVVERAVGCVPRPDEPARVLLGQTGHEAQPEPHGPQSGPRPLQGAVPARVVDVDGAHLDPVPARVGDQLGGGVEAHRQGVQDGGEERVGVVVLGP